MEGKVRPENAAGQVALHCGADTARIKSHDVLSLSPPLVNIEQCVCASDLTPAIDCWSKERPRLGEKKSG